MVEQTKSKILDTALQLFMKFGFKRVTMDDLSRQLSVSKKTLYKFFLSKDHLLESIFEWKKSQINLTVSGILDNEKLLFPDKLTKIFKFISNEVSNLHVEFLAEIQFNKPELWETMQQFKKETIQKHFNQLVKEGQEKGYLRDDIDRKVFVAIYYNTIISIMTPDFLSTVPHSNKDVYRMILTVFLEGLLTHKSRNEFKI